MNDAIIYCQKCKQKTYHTYDNNLSLHCGIATFVCGICDNRKKLTIIAEEEPENRKEKYVKPFAKFFR